MATMIRVTQAAGAVTSTSDDEVILINADMIVRIDDTDDNYAGDCRIQLSDGSAIYVVESQNTLANLINK